MEEPIVTRFISRPHIFRIGSALLMLLSIGGCASLPGAAALGGMQGGASAHSSSGSDGRDAASAAPDAGASGLHAQAGAAGQAQQDGSSSSTSPQTAASARTGLDSLSPNTAIDFNTAEVRRDLWQRIREGFAIPDLTKPELLQNTEQWYASKPEYMQRMALRGSRYLFHIVEEVQRRGLPTELALLPFVESAFNPQALSSAKASGMWQFMPATGRDFDLRQNAFRDDRRDVLASTRAALDYLTRLHAQFGHWHLALAAYNWGEGNVQRALARNQRAGLPLTYESLQMPDETRRYVPKLLAIRNIVAQPQQFSVTLPPLENHPYFLTVPIERDIDVSLAARLAGLSVEDFSALNPQHNKPVILAAGTPRVLLPFDNAEQFLNAVEKYKGNLATWTAWVAPRTLKPAEAAHLTGMSEAALRDVNRIPKGMLIRQGSALLVPRGPRMNDVSEKVADTASMSLQREVVVKPKSTKTASSKPGAAGKSQVASAKRKAPAVAKAPAPKRVVTAKPADGKAAHMKG